MSKYKKEDMRRGEVHSIIANATLAKHAPALTLFIFYAAPPNYAVCVHEFSYTGIMVSSMTGAVHLQYLWLWRC